MEFARFAQPDQPFCAGPINTTNSIDINCPINISSPINSKTNMNMPVNVSSSSSSLVEPIVPR